MSTLVYSYGAKPPINPGPVLEQIWLAHRYQNKLIEIERARREARDAYMATVLPAEKLAREEELQGLIDASFEATRKDRQKARSRVKMPAEQRQQVADWKAELKALRAELKEIRGQVREAERSQEYSPLAAIQGASNQAVKDARATCGVYWGTYLLVERAMDLAAKSPIPPRFRCYDQAGQIGVQLQGRAEGAHRAGLPLNELITDTRLQVMDMTQTDWRPGGPNPNLSHWRLLRIRIGSEGRAPIWAEVPFRMHRPLPPGSVITWATVQRQRCGTTFSWSVQFTLDTAPLLEPIVHPSPGSVCGIDIGWRKFPDFIRAAVLTDGQHHEEVGLSASVIAQFDKPCGIREVRDRHFNGAVMMVKQLRSIWPEWLQDAAQNISHWRSTEKLSRVVLRWRRERFAGDEEVFPALEAWRKQNRHLWEMESHLRQRGQRARKHIYRNWALSVCRRYGQIVLEGRDLEDKVMDLRPLAALPAEDSLADPLPQSARNYRTWAACSVLRDALKQAAKKTGTVITVTPARYTTMTCAVCGVVDSVDRESVEVRCRHCLETQDQDVRAALNLASAAVPPESLAALACV